MSWFSDLCSCQGLKRFLGVRCNLWSFWCRTISTSKHCYKISSFWIFLHPTYNTTLRKWPFLLLGVAEHDGCVYCGCVCLCGCVYCCRTWWLCVLWAISLYFVLWARLVGTFTGDKVWNSRVLLFSILYFSRVVLFSILYSVEQDAGCVMGFVNAFILRSLWELLLFSLPAPTM